MNIPDVILNWLLEGDVAIQYQVHRDLLDNDRHDLQERIATEGWGARFLAARNKNGHWGSDFYHPKWTSSHYTLLDLRYLCFPSRHPDVLATIDLILNNCKDAQGSINPHRSANAPSDVCINGMFLIYACYFGIEEQRLRSVIDYLIRQQMPDGGFNCEREYGSPVHSSLHSTISVLEGIHEFLARGYTYNQDDLKGIEARGHEFIFRHQLFRSEHSGEIIDPKMVMLSFPSRWRYDILRTLEYFRNSKVSFDQRMQPALDMLIKKQRKDGLWPVQTKHPGQIHFEMEQTGNPSRWNTLRALRVLRFYG